MWIQSEFEVLLQTAPLGLSLISSDDASLSEEMKSAVSLSREALLRLLSPLPAPLPSLGLTATPEPFRVRDAA